MKQEELKEALKEDFTNMDLRGWSFKGQNLSGANFSNADLEGACFIDTVLVSTNFEGANLKNADFSCVNAWSANFNETNCKDTVFLSANLTEASFEGADLDCASFAQANLTEANLQDTNIIAAEFDNTVGVFPVCPTHDSFIGWTIGEDEEGNECLVEVSIPTWAQRSSGTTRKCRAEILYIESIERLKDGYDPIEVTLKNRNYILTENDVVRDNDYEVDRFKVSSTDLYFWISKEEALAHARKHI
ncbi:pentapeptide repeat protein [Lachnoanaerobaculum saburreum F0468]|jgi:pentapeptide repeat protein|uniref:Pentapeptide repeat protein n=3 Tax=root TaxID=1 RepID=I0R803_9FIRM|nr:pentapeptide repeat-containing protein [Lachnoanaerobaculum saburreum]EFU78100.1 pentapeptide repeat protein [Lachnoanaerobaculum saburreum DSM 3986]EIC95811.1 pentapeptide repeat protein [Lachnoanaerobaculum saburreum F0468]DAD68660.1 MAG TPA: pentapeptide repeat protein [Siphoviridae sp. ctlXU33]